MNIDEAGTADKCERILRSALLKEPELSIHEEERLRRALSWHKGNLDDNLSLVEWLSITRLLGDVIAVRLDTGDTYRFLQFDHDRNRVIYVDPTSQKNIPVEEVDAAEIFKTAAVSLVAAEDISPKKYRKLTAVTNDEHGTRLIFGDYTDGINWITDDNEEIWFDHQTTFSLPRPMTTDAINEWIEENDLMKLIEQNHEQNWGDGHNTPCTPD